MPTIMDSTDDVTYLNYLREKNSSFLLQSNDVALGVQDPTLNCETIFEELNTGTHAWTIDGLPVLLNGSVLTEEERLSNIVFKEEAVSPADIDCSEPDGYPIEVPSEGFITSNGLFLPNDVLLQLNLQSDIQEGEENDQNINSANNEMEIFVNSDNQVYELNFKKKDTQVQSKTTDTNISENNLINITNLNTNGEMIQLLNADGSIININKDLLTTNERESKEKQLDFGEYVETVTAYKCKRCCYLTESTNEMSQHISRRLCEPEKSNGVNKIKMKSILNTNPPKNKSQQVILLCSECNKGYTNTEDLKQHMISKHQLVVQDPTENQKENTAKTSTLDKRKQEYVGIIKSQHKASKKIKCSVKGCELRFATDDYRVRHEHCHVNGNKRQFQCPACDKLFSAWRVCSLHLWKCHEIDAGLLNCVTCDYKAFSAHKLLSHMLIHKEQKQFLCNECGKSFKQMTQLRNHQVLHLNHSQAAPNWSSHKKCDICGNIFSDSKGLKKHIQSVHNKFKPYVCNICGHKSSRKAMLELHLRQHTGEKPYSCHICSYRTGDHNSLRRHLMRHDGTKKYSCPHCDYQCIQSVAYKLHIVTKHPGKEGIFFCKRCPFHSVNKNSIATHEKMHDIESAKTTSGQTQTNVESESTPLIINEEQKCDDLKAPPKKMSKIEEDEETQHGFLTSVHNDETVDTGGITIPADLELNV